MHIKNPISSNNYLLSVGSKVKIVGDIEETARLISTNGYMVDLINDDQEYKIDKITDCAGHPDEQIVFVADWWWSPGNMFKIDIPELKTPKIKSNFNQIFDIARLDI